MRFARKHARDFARTFGIAVDPANRDRCASAGFTFFKYVMLVGPSRDLREMRHAQHLRFPRQPAQTNADCRSRRAADSEIDFIEHERSFAAFAGQHDDQRQQHASGPRRRKPARASRQ